LGTIPNFVSLGDTSAEIHLENVIVNLDEYCAANGIKVCLVLDEFQEICNLKESEKVEALLRGGMQTARHVSFMMLGSRRTILRDMFEDRQRPFYKSAYVMKLSPMPENEFADYLIRQFAVGELVLSRGEADQIIAFTEACPYYTQKLAMLYFDMKRPGASVAEAQRFLVEWRVPTVKISSSGLPITKRDCCKPLPCPVRPASFQPRFDCSPAWIAGGVQSSLAKLKKLDLVEQDEVGWRVTDPLFCKWLAR